MATHDYVIANGTGAAVRSDLNGALAAIVSNNSSATEPATMYAYQWWADTTTGLLKIRNSANSAWISLRELDGTLTIEDGTAAAPGLAFTSDLNTGLFRVGADQVAITTGGTSRLAVSTTAVSSTLAVDVPLGAVGTPSITFTGDLNTGLFSPGADTLALVTGGTNRVHVTSGGLVGIGTTNPGANHALQIGGNQKYLSVIPNTGAGGAVNPSDAGGLHFGWNRSNGDGESNIVYGTGSGATPRLSIASWDGTTYTERMRITSAGALLANITSPVSGNSNTLNSVDSNVNSWAVAGRHAGAGGTSRCILAIAPSESDLGGGVFFLGNSTGTDRFIVWTNGNVVNTNNSYGAISDIKLKENIVDASSQWDDLKALQVRKYNFKEGQTHTQIGLVAQEVELVSPGLVSESPDRDSDGNDLGTVTKSVNYSVLYMKAVKALQEAMERIEALETRLSALEAA